MFGREKEEKQEDQKLDGTIDDILDDLQNEPEEELTWGTSDDPVAAAGNEVQEDVDAPTSSRGDKEKRDGKFSSGGLKPSPLLIAGIAAGLALVVGLVLVFVFVWNPFSGGKAAAKVNGEVITVETLDARIESMSTQNPAMFDPEQGGIDEAIIRDSILQTMIDNLLLEQEAKREGVEITDEVVQEAVDARIGTYPDKAAFEKDLEANGYTLDFFKSQIRAGMLIEALMDKKVPEDSVSEVDVASFYNDNKEKMFTDPEGAERSLEEVEPSIRAMLLTGARNELRISLVNALRETAKIEILDPKIVAYQESLGEE
jgi:hypothetical protein